MLTSLLLKRHVRKRRLAAGALFASLYVIFLFIPGMEFMVQPIVKLFYSFTIVSITFGFSRFRSFFQCWLLFYFVTFMVGGGMLGAHYFFKQEVGVYNGAIATQSSGFGDPISWLFVVVGFPVIWFFSKKRIDEIETKKIHFDQIATVKIKIDEVLINASALIDSGNQLRDPLSGAPVMILDMTIHSGHFSDGFLEKAKNVTDFQNDGEVDRWEHRLRIVPFRAVGQEHQFLCAIKPDEVEISTSEETIVVTKVLLGLSFQSLSGEKEYSCILHPKMLSGKANAS